MPKRIPLNGKYGKGKFTILDEHDYYIFKKYPWYVSRLGYVQRSGSRNGAKYQQRIWMHRTVIRVPTGYEVDHINNNKLDNRRSNLRICTRSENCRNRSAMPGSSKYKGVSWDKSLNKWRAYIGINGRQNHLGLFSKEYDAAGAYNIAAKKLHGNFAYFNKVK